VNAEIEHAAAEHGAPTAKAEGELAPGVKGAPPRAVEDVADIKAQKRRTASARAAVASPPEATVTEPPDAERRTSAAAAAAGAVRGVRVLPLVAAWAGWWLLSRVTGKLSGRDPRRARSPEQRRAA
jgi:hypothetical protein